MAELTPSQAEIAKDTHRFRVVNAGRRFGKTILAAEEIKGIAIAKPSQIAYFATTYDQARSIIWKVLKKELEPVIKSTNEQRLEIVTHTIKGGESIITLRGWENVPTVRGQHFDFLVLDEVAQMREFWSRWEEDLRATLIDRRGSAMFISTPLGFNHFYDLYNKEGTDEDYKSFHFTTYDNPHIPYEEIEKIKAEIPEDRFAQENLADFRKQQGLVYKEFDRQKHVFAEMPPYFVQTISGLDAGFTNPTAYYLIGRDLHNVYWIFKEWYKTGQTEGQVVEYVASNKQDLCYPDPEAAALCEALRRAGVPIREVNKGKDSVVNGIAKVRELLFQGKLKVHNSCINLIEEFETYAYPDKRELHNEDELPIKEHDHGLDAIRYALMMNAPTTQGQRAITNHPTPIPSRFNAGKGMAVTRH